jgi:hypothetical protein
LYSLISTLPHVTVIILGVHWLGMSLLQRPILKKFYKKCI